MGGRDFASTSMQVGENSCVEFAPLDFTTVTYVNLYAEIGKYGYQHIGTTAKISVTSLMSTFDEM